MGQRLSGIDWRSLESSSPTEQKAFLSEWAHKYKIKPFTAVRRIKKADHLVVNRYGYTHHLICTEVNEHSIMAMEYSGPRNDWGISEMLVGPENACEVHEKQLTFEQLEEMKVKKIVWPNNLRRFRAQEAVRRAKSRKGERRYKCLMNNCEHFVVWCICGLSVSLQLKTWHTWAKKMANFVCATIRSCGIQAGSYLLVVLVFFLKDLYNKSDKMFSNMILSILVNDAAFAVACVIALVIELRLGYFKWKKASDDRENGDIPTDNDLDAKRVEIIAKAFLHLMLGSAGFYAGLHGLTRENLVLGLIYSVVRGVFGIVAGNLLGATAKWYVRD